MNCLNRRAAAASHASSRVYATGTFGSRRIEQTTYDNVAVRLITGDTHSDHDTICTFRWENKALLNESFVNRDHQVGPRL
jgi:hypothetical protein